MKKSKMKKQKDSKKQQVNIRSSFDFLNSNTTFITIIFITLIIIFFKMIFLGQGIPSSDSMSFKSTSHVLNEYEQKTP